jgi:hypothetical protein
MHVNSKTINLAALASILCFVAITTGSLRAQSTAPSPSPVVSATPAASATPTLEQRVAGLEAYLTNADPTVPLKDKDGNIPKDLTTCPWAHLAPDTMLG